METLFCISQLELPVELQRKITEIHKHNLLEPKYRRQFKELNNHILYYGWMNKKIRKYGLYQQEPEPTQSLMKTIKYFDYYKPHKAVDNPRVLFN